MKILSDAEDNKDIPSLEIVQNLISKVVAKTVPCDNEVITENYKLGTDVQTALSNLLTYTYVNASGISQLSTSLQSAWNTINSLPDYTGGSGIVVSGSVIGHSNNLTAEGTVNTGAIQTPDFGENATLTWFKYDKQGHVTFTGTGGITIPTADTTLSSTSTRPISSKAVYDNLTASVIRATTKTVGSGESTTAIYENVQKTLEGFQSHIYKLHTDITTLGNNVGVLNTYKDSINISAGSKTVPVYFSNGVPTVCQYTLGSICTKSTSDYLPIKGGTLTGLLKANADVCIPTGKSTADNSVPLAGSANLTITNADFKQLKNYKSFMGGVNDTTNNVWYNAINVRHRNGYGDGANYGMYIRTKLISSGDLIWNKQTAASTWQGERTIVDSGNYTTYFKNSASNIAGTGLEYVDYVDSSGKNITKINHKKGSMSGTIGPDPVTYTPNFGETFDVGYAQYDNTGHIILSSTAKIKLPKYTSLKNPFALTIQGNGTKLVTYDGAGPVTLNITPSTIGASASSHTHSYLPLAGGTVTGTTIFSQADYAGQLKINRASTATGVMSCIDYLVNNNRVGILGFADNHKLYIRNASDKDMLTIDSYGNAVFSDTITTPRLFGSITTGTYLNGNKGGAIINSTAPAGSYTMLAKMNSTNGVFTHGVYTTGYLLQYTANSTISAGTNAVTKSVRLLDESGNSSFPGTVTATTFSGNATSASKLATARTLNGVSFDGTANKNIPIRSCHFYSETTAPSAPWHKVASTKLTDAHGDRVAVFFIEKSYNGGSTGGILKAHIRSDSSATKLSYARVRWLVKGTGIDKSNWKLVTYTASSGIVAELWAKETNSYMGYNVVLLSEFNRTATTTTNWTLYSGNTGVASSTSGTDWVSSIMMTELGYSSGTILASGSSNIGKNGKLDIAISNLSSYNIIIAYLSCGTSDTGYPTSPLLVALPVKAMSEKGLTINVGPVLYSVTVSAGSPTAIKGLSSITATISNNTLHILGHDNFSCIDYKIYSVC